MRKIKSVQAACLQATSVVLCAASMSAAQAQQGLQADASATPEIVVTASRTEQPLKDVVADITVIDRAAIENSGASAVVDVLSRAPGIQIYRNGGPGSSTNLLLRGADSKLTAVYVDGVRFDSQTISGGATWEAIPLSQIDRIEVLRGPAAAIYGSDAVAGVIQIFTRKGAGAFTPFFGVGLGTYKTKKIDAGFSGKQGLFDYSLGLSQESSDGFHVRQGSNPDKDGYSSQSSNIRAGLQMNAAHRIDATLLTNYINSQFDGTPLTADHHTRHQLQTTGLTWKAKWTDALSTKAMVTRSKSHYDTYPSISNTDTNVTSYLLQSELRRKNQFITAVIERREDALQNISTTPAATNRSQNAVALGYGLNLDSHTLQLNARRDVNSAFGLKTTASAAYAYDITPEWRATASIGTAFRAPTLYQQFSSFGSVALKPEVSTNREVGLKYANNGNSFGVVAYKNKISNLISFVTGAKSCASTLGCYVATKNADLQGVTMSGAVKVGNIKLAASMDWLRPQDLDINKTLARRAQRVAMLSADVTVESWQLGSEFQLVQRRFDDAANLVVLGGYSMINFYGTRKITRDVSLLLRVNNATNHVYQTANTYNTAGRNAFVGIRWEPN